MTTPITDTPFAPADAPAANDWTQLFTTEGLTVPPVPAELAATLRPVGPAAFATPGWPATQDVGSAMAAWLAEPDRPRAWVGWVGHGLRSTALRLCLAMPDAGFFIQRRWGEAYGDGPQSRRRIEGAFKLLAQTLASIRQLQADGLYPTDRRLVLVDDDFAQLRWGWVMVGAASAPALAPDSLAYISVLATLDALGKIPATAP